MNITYFFYLSFPLFVQYIVYYQLEQKVRKIKWHDNQYTSKELLLEIENLQIYGSAVDTSTD